MRQVSPEQYQFVSQGEVHNIGMSRIEMFPYVTAGIDMPPSVLQVHNIGVSPEHEALLEQARRSLKSQGHALTAEQEASLLTVPPGHYDKIEIDPAGEISIKQKAGEQRAPRRIWVPFVVKSVADGQLLAFRMEKVTMLLVLLLLVLLLVLVVRLLLLLLLLLPY